MKKHFLLIPFLLLGTFAAPAYAQSTSAASQQLFQDGTALLKQGKVHEACLKLDESQKLDPQLGTLLNLASCHEKEGRLATAWTEYSEVAELATKRGEDKRATYAKTKVNDLQPQLPRLQVVVPAGTTSVTLDGAALGQPAWNVALPVDPGDHVITYSAPSKKPGTQNISTPKGKTTTVTLAALVDDSPEKQAPIVIAPPPPRPATTEPPPPAEHAKGSPLRTAGYGVAAIGVVGLGVGSVFGLIALGDKSTVTNDCQGTQCSQAGLDAVSSARRDSTISTIGFVAGGVCLAAGVTMILLGKKKSSPQVGLAPMMTAGAGGLFGFGSF